VNPIVDDTVAKDEAPTELVLTTGPAANGGSCVARHDGRVVFVRYALPGELVRARIRTDRGSYWHADTIEVIEPSADRVDSLCPIAGVDGAGCCDLAFADPAAARIIKGQVVANQLARLGGHQWEGCAEPIGDGDPHGWRVRVRLDVNADGRPGFHRYHSSELVDDLRCGQLPVGMLDGLDAFRWRPGEHIHVVLDSDGNRHVLSTSERDRKGRVIEGDRRVMHRVGDRNWQIPVNGFWQSHRAAAQAYSAVVAQWVADAGGVRVAWDLYGGAGLFAPVLADLVGQHGSVLTVDTSRAASAAARSALADLPQVQVRNDSVRGVLAAGGESADVAVLDPPRSGAGKTVIDLLAQAGVSRVIHIGCEAAAFARDIGLYRAQGYAVESIRVFDSFPLTHRVECIALLIKAG